MAEYHPVYNRETPEQFKKIFAELAETYISSKPGRARYNPETFVIEQEDSSVAENLAVLSEHELQNPHIKFFVDRNPGWKKVNCRPLVATLAGELYYGKLSFGSILIVCKIFAAACHGWKIKKVLLLMKTFP